MRTVLGAWDSAGEWGTQAASGGSVHTSPDFPRAPPHSSHPCIPKERAMDQYLPLCLRPRGCLSLYSSGHPSSEKGSWSQNTQHLPVRTSVLRPPGEPASPWESYFSQGRPSLKNLLVLCFFMKFSKLWMLIWMLSELFTSLGTV